MKKILVICNHLNVGGVQTSLIPLLNEMGKKHDVSLFCVTNNFELKYRLDDNVKTLTTSNILHSYYKILNTPLRILPKKMKLLKIIYKVLRKIKLERIIEKIIVRSVYFDRDYDVAISYVGRPGVWDTLLFERVKSLKYYTWIHSNPKNLNLNKKNYSKYYSRFDNIFLVSKSNYEVFLSYYPELRTKSKVLYNLIDEEYISLKSESSSTTFKNQFNIVSVSRIDNNSKRLDRVIEVCNNLLNLGFNDFVWHIVGDGPDYNWLYEEVARSCLQKNVKLHGHRDNPYPLIKEANLFAIVSDYEGLPVTMMESLYLKTPVLSTNFGSEKEIIEENVTGFIVDKNVESITKKIVEILNNDKKYVEVLEYLDKFPYKNRDTESLLRLIED